MLLVSTIVETLSDNFSSYIFIRSLTDTDKLFSILSNFLSFENLNNIDENSLILYISISILFIFLLKNIFISFVNFYNLNLIRKIRTKISNDLFYYYLKNDYEFHISRNPSGLIRNITSETGHCTSLITSTLLFLREILVAIAILSLLVIVDVWISLLIFIILGIFFNFIFPLYKKRFKI